MVVLIKMNIRNEFYSPKNLPPKCFWVFFTVFPISWNPLGVTISNIPAIKHYKFFTPQNYTSEIFFYTFFTPLKFFCESQRCNTPRVRCKKTHCTRTYATDMCPNASYLWLYIIITHFVFNHDCTWNYSLFSVTINPSQNALCWNGVYFMRHCHNFCQDCFNVCVRWNSSIAIVGCVASFCALPSQVQNLRIFHCKLTMKYVWHTLMARL